MQLRSHHLGSSALLAFLPALASARSDEGAPAGQYLEARTAAVFAGACHFGGEFTTNGREALLAWSFESGAYAGVELGGLRVALVVTGAENLSAPLPAATAAAEPLRQAVLFLPREATSEQRSALSAWVRQSQSGLLEGAPAEALAKIEFEREGDSYALRIGQRIALEGELLAERECCKMPYQVWYEPFQPLRERVVGQSSEFRCADPRVARRWNYSGVNDAFVGRF